MSKLSPSYVFATLPTNKKTEEKIVSPDIEMEGESPRGMGTKVDRFIKVSSVSELSLAPDRCKVLFTLHSIKEQVQDVKNSVARRMDYVIQTLINHNVREADITVNKVLRLIDKLYHYEVEVMATFSDFNKCFSLCNLLVEKLQDSIKVSTPHYFHSSHRLENLRQQAGLLALSGAKKKALDMGKSLQAAVGKVLNITEDSSEDWQGVNTNIQGGIITATQQSIDAATVHCRVKLNATFELQNNKIKLP